MDDLAQYVLQQVSFSGSIGSNTEQLWCFVENFYKNISQEHNLDLAYKDYVWSILLKSTDFLLYRKLHIPEASQELCLINKDLKSEMSSHHDAALVCRTTEQRQWYALTGHGIDHKQIPALSFACLSAISSRREEGVTLIDICKITGQDKRSAPARCKSLSSMGLVSGFPVLVRGSNTTLYVHQHFLAGNALQRESQGHVSGRSHRLDLHLLRRRISDCLAASTNKILKLRDCCHMLKMTTQQSDKWTQRRFSFQILTMSQAGYVRRVRVPGKQSGSLILCVELLKEYTDDDNSLQKQDLMANQQTEDAENSDDSATSEKEEAEELDLSRVANQTLYLALSRDLLLEQVVQQVVQKAGPLGLPGPQLAKLTVSRHWQRPFDEQIKRLAPPTDLATQPSQYSCLALAPASEEVIGKVRQYRYFASQENGLEAANSGASRASIPLTAAELPAVLATDVSKCVPPPCPVAGRVENRGRSSTTLARPLKHSAADTRASSAPKRDSSTNLTLSSTTRNVNSTAIETQPRTTEEGERSVPEASPSDPPGRISKRRKIESFQPANVLSSHTPSGAATDGHCTSTDIAPEDAATSHEGGFQTKASTFESLTKEANMPKPRLVVTPRDSLRKNSTNTTVLQRKVLITKLIAERGGIIVFNTDFITDYDKLLFAETGVRQKADRKTLKRTLNDMTDTQELFWTVRVLPSNAGRIFLRKDIYSLEKLQADDLRLEEFIRTIVDDEGRKNVLIHATHAEKNIDIVPRPEMDVIPTAAQRNSSRATIRPLDLSTEELQQLRVRLSEKASIDQAGDTISWYNGKTRLPSLQESRENRKMEIESRKVERLQRTIDARRANDAIGTRLRNTHAKNRIVSRDSRVNAHTSIDNEGRASVSGNSAKFTELFGERADEERSLELPTHSDTPSTSRFQKDQKPKKSVSKRADRFAADDDNYNAEATVDDEPQLRRKHHMFTADEDDVLIRTATLSALFFAKNYKRPNIDWELTQLLLPWRTEIVLRQRYATTRNRTKYKIIQKFIWSTTFAQLYNEGVQQGNILPVPRNRADAEGFLYDFSILVDYSRRFDPERFFSFSGQIPDLAADFHEQFTFKKIAHRFDTNWRDDYHAGTSITIKRQILQANAFCVFESLAPTPNEELPTQNLVSAIKSLLLMAESDYRPEEGLESLKRYGPQSEIERTLATMLDDGLVVGTKGEENRVIPGRNYQLSDRFFSRLKSRISTRTFKAANKFDALLQDAFLVGKKVLFPYLANDGTSAATIELACRRNLLIQHGIIDWDEQGFIDDYSVRQIDASCLDFEVILSKGADQSPCPSSSDKVMLQARPCYWLDISGNLMESIYRRTVALILSLIASRGRLDRSELLRLCSPVMLGHELDQCLHDLIQKNVLKHNEDGFDLMSQYYKILA